MTPPTHTSDLEHSADGPLGPEQLARIVDLSPDAILLLDKDLKIRVWNLGAEQTFGYSAAEAIGQHFDLLVPDDLREASELEEILESTNVTGELRDYRTRRVCKDGRELLVSLVRRRLIDASGEFSGTIAILRDITESVRLRRQAANDRHLAAIGNIASQVAHEIRNPLAGIHGALQVLRRRFPPDSSEQEIFQGLTEEIRRLDQLVTDLQRFGRPTPIHLQEFDLTQWLQSTAPGLAACQQPPVDLQLDIQSDELIVRSDPSLLQDVLNNLLVNAVEGRTENRGATRVRIQLKKVNKSWELEFQDDGPGIPSEYRDRLMEPFVTSKVRGSGLGLAVCLRNVENLGGSLELIEGMSAGSLGGACFLIHLPIA